MIVGMISVSYTHLLEADVILNVWLKTVPEYSSIFLRLMLCVAIIDAVANPLMISEMCIRDSLRTGGNQF